MNKNWSLQDVRPVDRKKRSTARSSAAIERKETDMRRRSPEETTGESDDHAPAPPRRRSSNRPPYLHIGAGVLGIVALILLVSTFRTGAELLVTQKTAPAAMQSGVTAYVAPMSEQLGYELMTLEADGERQVSASGQEPAEERARGTITIYNAYSDSPQRLIKNTRFESSDGHIYRIEESVEIPGRRTDDAGGIVPGSTTAHVFADDVGEEYNIEPTHFTVPGLEGTDQFEGIYAESAEAFTGGFVGMRYIIDNEELARVQQQLHEEIRTALISRLESERPAGFVLYQDAVTITFTSLPATEGGGDLATIREHGTLRVPIFSEEDFGRFIARSVVPNYDGEPVIVADPAAYTFTYTSTTTASSDIAALQSIDFSLNGTGTIVWTYDEAALKESLRGSSRDDLPSILADYPAILNAEATIRPFWKNAFPEDPQKIVIRAEK